MLPDKCLGKFTKIDSFAYGKSSKRSKSVQKLGGPLPSFTLGVMLTLSYVIRNCALVFLNQADAFNVKAILHWQLSFSLNNIIVQLLQRLGVPVSLKPVANNNNNNNNNNKLYLHDYNKVLQYCKSH